MISFGRRRAVVPPSSEGDGAVAQRQVAQAAVKAAEKARNAVLVDGWRCRVWARNPRGSIKCPCSSEAARPPVDSTLDPSADFVIPRYEGDDERWADSGSADPEHESSSSSPVDASYPAKSVNEEQVEYLERLLLGEGSRCAICFGTGFIDGYRLWGGERLVMCSAVDSPGVTLVDGTAVVDFDADTPTMLGPGVVTWELELLGTLPLVDVARLRDGLGEGTGTLEARIAGTSDEFVPLQELLGPEFGGSGGHAALVALPTTLEVRLTLADGDRASHVEVVVRAGELPAVQLPQVNQAGNREIVAAFITEDFELDPRVGAIERQSVIEVPPQGSAAAQLYVVTDVTVKRVAGGSIFGVVGQVRNVQPVEVLVALSVEGDYSGVVSLGAAPSGLEATGAGMNAGLLGEPDDGAGAMRRGPVEKTEGDGSPSRVITLQS